MRKLLFMAFLFAGCTSLSSGQTPDEPKHEFFAGYSFHSADINTLTIDPHRTGQNGANIAYKRNLNSVVGFKVDASAHFKRDSQTLAGGQFSSRRDQYYFLAGLEFEKRGNRGVTPFAHALAGASLFRGFTTLNTPTGNIFTFDDATSLAIAVGGGLDVRVSDRIAMRVFQVDYIPSFFGPGRQDNFRMSVGVVFKR
jgi:opacity protein-like surface antigen